MIGVLLVDDETPARVRMRRLLDAYPDLEILGEASNGIEALEKIDALKPDLVFLDIEMPELDGINLARTIGAQGPAIIFVTAYDEFALKAFETHAIDYVVKPVANARLRAALDKFRAHSSRSDLTRVLEELGQQQAPTRMGLKSGNRYVVIDLTRVSAILSKDHYSAVQVDGKEFLSDDTLDVLEKRLDPKKFLRVHRGAIVNLDFIQELEREGDRKFTAVLSDTAKTKVSIARERLDEVKKRLGL